MIGDLIGEWIKGILIDGIMGNLSGLFNTVNTKVGEIASDVGSTPQDWNGGIFSMLQNLSETVIVPIAAAILALVMCYELIDMIVEKNNIFENLCDLYNYLDASIHVQFSFINRKIDPKQYAKSFEIRAQGDDFDDIRSEYSDILQDQLVNGNNGLMKRKFMTYTIEADSLKMARARLRRIETDLLGYFKSMGASAWGLDAKERLEVMHSIFHPDGEPFSFLIYENVILPFKNPIPKNTQLYQIMTTRLGEGATV